MKISTQGELKMFSYYSIQLKLINDLLATCPTPEVYNDFILKKAKDSIDEASKIQGKISKKLEKYRGAEITSEQEMMEISGIVRSYQLLLNDETDISQMKIQELLEFSAFLLEKFNNGLKSGTQAKSTVFMFDSDGCPGISSHMLIGFFRAGIKMLTNNGNKTHFKSKVSVDENTPYLKFIEGFIKSSNDIRREEDGTPYLCVRPLRTNVLGKAMSVLAASQVIPAGSEFSATLRVLKGSAFDDIKYLGELLTLARSCGIGCNRSSNNYGQFLHKIEKLKDFKEVHPFMAEGWN